jgi:hypothetical protein
MTDHNDENLPGSFDPENNMPYLDDAGFTDLVMQRVSHVRKRRSLVLQSSLALAFLAVIAIISQSGFNLAFLTLNVTDLNDWIMVIGFWIMIGFGWFILRSEKVIDL